MHSILPVTSLYVPATHTVQVPPLGPVYPSMQMQSVDASLPGSESELPGHAWHMLVVAADVVEY